MTSRHILIIDDDTRLRNLLGKFLDENGFVAHLAKDTQEARQIISKHKLDLLIVDVMLPQENGVDFVTDLRKSSGVPIVMLTARGEPGDRIKGLEAGADDYLQKPFEPKELLLRINNVIRRETVGSKVVDENLCKFGDFVFSLRDSRLKKGEEFVHITESEAKILTDLCKEKGSVVSREALALSCGDIDARSIDVQINRIRKKIEVNPKQPVYLHTVRNRGYVLYE